jgi:hypothetical protein
MMLLQVGHCLGASVRPCLLLLSWLKLDAVSFHPFPPQKKSKKKSTKERISRALTASSQNQMIIYDYSGFSIELPVVAIGPRTGNSKEQRRKTRKEQGRGGEGMVQYYPVSHLVDEKYPAKTKALSNRV